jgi:ketosteroid isomerase-like protein
MSEATWAELSSRLGALEDERAIRATLYRYGHALDYGAEADWVNCFTEDALYEVRYRVDGGAGTGRVDQHRGHQQLAAFAAGHSRPPQRWHKHVLIEPIIELDGDRATVTSYFLRIDEHEGERVIYAFGRYLDMLMRTPDGRWRFATRVAEVESRSALPAPRRRPTVGG